MVNQFQIFIQNILADKFDILPGSSHFIPEVESTEEILKSINISFLIILAGSNHCQFSKANEFLNKIKSNNIYTKTVEFYLKGLKVVEQEITQIAKKDTSFINKLEELNNVSFSTHNYEQIVGHFWKIFFPEAYGLFDSDTRKVKVENLRELRKINITKKNPDPITDPANEMLFTSNILLTTPLDFKGKKHANLKEYLKNNQNESQKYWYDHPIPVGVSPQNNEVLYGLTGLTEMLQFEKSRGNAKRNDTLDCLLSVSVTHESLHKIAKDYLMNEINNSNSIQDLNIYVFTEDETRQLTEEILIPIAKKHLNTGTEDLNNLRNILGVDGEYGKHYSFLKAVAALWQVFINPKIKGTFKIDFDQVFPNAELVDHCGASAFDHFKTELWGANGRDAHGNDVELSMIAGALVNQSDIEKSLFYPDVCFPTNNEIRADEHVFCSKFPQALSTEAEMMEKYNSENLDGENSVISRVHVTGGTNGILIKAMRSFRPFTPSFIGRAEDQAYLMSVIFEGQTYLRYLHKSGLIMRHDKQSFAGDAIKAAESGKIIGDYIRILLFSKYAKMLPWSLNRIKSELNPFTGCFITNIPYTVVYLRLVLFVNYLFSTEEEKNIMKANDLILKGTPRLLSMITNLENTDDVLLQKYLDERKAWHLFYDILDIGEKQIQNKDSWMLNIKNIAEKILFSAKVK